jgi:hypothetical protein
VDIHEFENGKWVPYVAKDVQLEFGESYKNTHHSLVEDLAAVQ